MAAGVVEAAYSTVIFSWLLIIPLKESLSDYD